MWEGIIYLLNACSQEILKMGINPLNYTRIKGSGAKSPVFSLITYFCSPNTRVWLQTSKTQEYRELFFGPAYKEVPYPVQDGFFEFTPTTFEAIYGLQPVRMIDKKAIEGDKSDFIPGVKGVGEKAVVPLLQEFETVEQIYATIEGMNKQEEASFKELCKDLGISRSPLAYLLKTTSNPEEPLGKDAAYLSKVLATIKTDIPFYESLPLDDIMLQVNDQGLLDIWASNWNLTV